MRCSRSALVVAAAAAAASFVAGSARGQDAVGAGGDLVLSGGTVYVGPGEAPIRDGAVLVRDGRIAARGERSAVRVPPGVPSLDCSGLTVTAGFWNSHVHLFERKWADAAALPGPELGRQLAETFTRHGFTSVFDTGSPWANTKRLRDRIESGEVPGPRVRSTGEALIAPGAMPGERVLAALGLMGFPAPEVSDVAQARAAARRLLDEGVDGIKVHLQPPPPPRSPLPREAIAAVADEAHRGGRPVFVHPHTGEDVRAAVQEGVDVVAHTTPRSGPWDAATLAAMRERGVALTPTLTLWRDALRHDRISAREALADAAVGQLRAWLAVGGTVLFGTDAGAVDPDPAPEYAAMAEAGMSFRQVLASLTTAPAGRLGEPGRTGRMDVGEEADLVVLEGDPGDDLRALASVRYTIRRGRVVFDRDSGR